MSSQSIQAYDQAYTNLLFCGNNIENITKLYQALEALHYDLKLIISNGNTSNHILSTLQRVELHLSHVYQTL